MISLSHPTLSQLFGSSAVFTASGDASTLAITVNELGDDGANISGTLSTEALFLAILERWYLQQGNDPGRLIEVSKVTTAQTLQVNKETMRMEGYSVKIFGVPAANYSIPDDI